MDRTPAISTGFEIALKRNNIYVLPRFESLFKEELFQSGTSARVNFALIRFASHLKETKSRYEHSKRYNAIMSQININVRQTNLCGFEGADVGQHFTR